MFQARISGQAFEINGLPHQHIQGYGGSEEEGNSLKSESPPFSSEPPGGLSLLNYKGEFLWGKKENNGSQSKSFCWRHAAKHRKACPSLRDEGDY